VAHDEWAELLYLFLVNLFMNSLLINDFYYFFFKYLNMFVYHSSRTIVLLD